MLKTLHAMPIYVEAITARAIAMLAQLGVGLITARALGPDGRGQYFYILTLGVIASQVGMIGLHASNTYLVARDHKLLSAIITNTIWIIFVNSIAASILICLLDYLLAGNGKDANILFVPLLCVSFFAFTCFSNLSVAIDRPRTFNLMIALNAVVLLGATLLAWSLKGDVFRFLLLTFFAMSVSAFASLYVVCDKSLLRWSFDKTVFRAGFRLGLRAYLTTLAAFLFSRLGLIVLRMGDAYDQVGYWSIAVQITDAMLVIPGTIGILVFPRWSRASHTERRHGLIKISAITGCVMMFFCAVVAFVADQVISLVFGHGFEPAAPLITALLPGIFCFSLVSIMSQYLTTYGVPRPVIAGWLIVCALYPLMATRLLHSFGTLGVAITQSVLATSLLVFFTLLCWIAARRASTKYTTSEELPERPAT